MPTNPQEAAATRAKALLLDLPWIFGIEKADQKPLEQAITAALTEARSAALREAMERLVSIAHGYEHDGQYELGNGLRAAVMILERMAGAVEEAGNGGTWEYHLCGGSPCRTGGF